MAMTQTNKCSLLASAIFFSLSPLVLADTDSFDIPMLDKATVFAEFTDDMPAVLNYFTSATEEQIIAFYQKHFGKPTLQQRKRGRLTLTYQQEKQTIRVVISLQNNKHQVDIIVEQVK